MKKWEDVVNVNQNDLEEPYPDNCDAFTINLGGQQEAVEPLMILHNYQRVRKIDIKPLKPAVIMNSHIMGV